MYSEGATLFEMVKPATRPLVWLFAAGGQHVLRRIEHWNYETALHRPKLGKVSKATLVAKAWWMSRFGNGAKASA